MNVKANTTPNEPNEKGIGDAPIRRSSKRRGPKLRSARREKTFTLVRSLCNAHLIDPLGPFTTQ